MSYTIREFRQAVARLEGNELRNRLLDEAREREAAENWRLLRQAREQAEAEAE